MRRDHYTIFFVLKFHELMVEIYIGLLMGHSNVIKHRCRSSQKCVYEIFYDTFQRASHNCVPLFTGWFPGHQIK